VVIIIPTIDAEGVHGRDPFRQMMLGDIGLEKPYGVPMLADIFNSHGISATFFLDVFEHTLFGEKALQNVCDKMLSSNQDVQLHTHPSWREDDRDFDHIKKLKREKSYLPQNKDFMFECTFEEQVKILEHGIDCIKRWTGKAPVAHRAGGYGLNEDTARALRSAGIPIDSSMRFGHRNSKISWSINRIVLKSGLMEIPVTGFKRILYVCPSMNLMTRKDPFRVTGINSCDLNELLWFVDELSGDRLKVMNLFMHSYSLLNYGPRFRWFNPAVERIEKLQNFLKYTVNRRDVVYMSMAQFWEHYGADPDKFDGDDYYPLWEGTANAFALMMKMWIKYKVSIYKRLGR